MNAFFKNIVVACAATALELFASSANAGAYDVAASKGARWLLSQRNVDDGSWGATDDVKFVQTSEAVLALGILNQPSSSYHAGLSWLDNHSPANTHAAKPLASDPPPNPRPPQFGGSRPNPMWTRIRSRTTEVLVRSINTSATS